MYLERSEEGGVGGLQKATWRPLFPPSLGPRPFVTLEDPSL